MSSNDSKQNFACPAEGSGWPNHLIGQAYDQEQGLLDQILNLKARFLLPLNSPTYLSRSLA